MPSHICAEILGHWSSGWPRHPAAFSRLGFDKGTAGRAGGVDPYKCIMHPGSLLQEP